MVRLGVGRIHFAGSRGPTALGAALVLILVSGALLSALITATGPDEAGDPPVAHAGDDILGVLLNDVVTLNGSASVDDELALCTWQWESTTHPDIRVAPANDSSPSFTVEVEDTTITFQLTLTDPSGQFSVDWVDVVVDANQPPRITIASPSPSGVEGPFYERSMPIEFTANGTTDPEGREDQLTYLWESNVSGDLSTKKYFTTVLTDLGWHRITLKVEDKNGGSSEEAMDIFVREDPFAPVARIDLRPSRADMRYGKSEQITLDASVTIDDNSFDTLQTMNFTWTTDRNGGTTIGYGPVVVVMLEEGRHVINLEVVDTDGLTDSEQVVLDSYNTPPRAQIRSVDMKVRNTLPTLNESEQGELSAEFSSDPDGDALSFEWDMGDGAVLRGRSVTHSWDSFGEYTVTLTADDGSENNSTHTVDLTISINSVPVAVADQNIQVEVGVSFTMTANGSYDQDGDELTYKWDFDGDGRFDSSRYDPTWKYNTEGEHEVLLQVSDGFAAAEATSIVVAVFPNEAPIARLLNEFIDGEILVPLSSGRGEVDLDASPSIDPDDDVDGSGEIDGKEKNNLSYSWDLDPSKDSDDDGITDNDADETGEEVTVKVTQSGPSTVILIVTDPMGSYGTLEIKLRGNHPPDTLSIRVGPSTKVLTGAQVTFTGSADDEDRADRNKLEYYWEFGDGDKTSTSNFQGKHTYREKGTYEVVLRVSDGLLGSTTITTVTVVDMELPSVSYPTDGSEVSGLMTLSGRIRELKGFEVDKVEVKEGEKTWKEAQGTTQWTYDLDTTKHSNGNLEIRIRYTVNDAEDIQTETLITVKVQNGQEGGVDWILLISLFVVLGVIVLVLFLLLRRKPRNWDDLLPPPAPGPRFPPMTAPGGLPPMQTKPSLPSVQPPKPTDAPKQAEPPKAESPALRPIRIKCPACTRVFKITDTGERPLHMTCKYCGATGSIDHVPGEKETGEEASVEEKAPEEDEAPIEPVPIVCPSCQNLFELDEVARTAKCPICGVEGDLDDDTVRQLKERFGEVEEFTLRCPGCSGTFKVMGGQSPVVCPHCGARGRATA